MAKKYDIVETSKLSGVYDGSKLVVTSSADEDKLENGRLVVNDEVAGKVKYPATVTDHVVLHASVEKMYDTTLGLTEFCITKGDKVRTFELEVGDKFASTAIVVGGTDQRANYDSIVKGDSVGFQVGTGKLVVFSDPTKNTCSFKAIVTQKKVLGYDYIPAIVVKVTEI